MSRSSLQLRHAVINYAVLTLTSASAFYFLREVVPSDSYGRYLFVLLGPAPSLFSHLSVYEFAFLSLFVFPWLLLAGKRAAIGLAGFITSWIGVGWFQWAPFSW